MLRDIERGGLTEVQPVLAFMLKASQGASHVVAHLHTHQSFRAAACRRRFAVMARAITVQRRT
jgi:hypothetical protein